MKNSPECPYGRFELARERTTTTTLNFKKGELRYSEKQKKTRKKKKVGEAWRKPSNTPTYIL